MAAMTVAQMIELFLKPGAPVHIESFDGSSYGSDDAPLTLQVKNSRAIYYMVNAPSELGLARAYLQGDIDSPQLVPGNPYALFKELVPLKSYLRTPNPAQLAKRSLRWPPMVPRPAPPDIEAQAVPAASAKDCCRIRRPATRPR